MERDMFQRPFRFTFRYGETEKRASSCGTFDMPYPRRIDQQRSGPVTQKLYGDSCVRDGLSPIATPGGRLANRTPDAPVVGTETQNFRALILSK